jgi:hypothetical protein
MVLAGIHMVPEHVHGAELEIVQGTHEGEDQACSDGEGGPGHCVGEGDDGPGTTKATKASIDKEKKDREQSRKKWRSEEKKKEEISLLEFTRQVVELTIQKHGAEKDRAINSQKEASAMLSPGALKDVRYDSGRHLPRLTNIKGVCKNCKEQTGQEKRTLFRCDRCKVALHAECFLGFHTSI